MFRALIPYSTLIFVLFFVITANAGNGNRIDLTSVIGSKSKKALSSKAGINITLQPALFYSSIGGSGEYVIGKKTSAGVNFLYKFGNIEGAKNTLNFKDEDHLKPGILAEAFFRYYIKIKGTRGKAPFSLYTQFSLGYNDIIYFDGNTRPLTLHNNWKELDNNQEVILESPQPYLGGLGAGYQLLLIPRHLIANLFVGLQGTSASDGKLIMSFFVSPSIGLAF